MTNYRVQLAFAIAGEADLVARPIADELLGGRRSRRAGGVTWTRGAAAHVVELTSTWPSTALDALAAHFAASVVAIDELLSSAGACLLPVFDETPLGLRLEIDRPPGAFTDLAPSLVALTGPVSNEGAVEKNGRWCLPLGAMQETITANLAVCAKVAALLEPDGANLVLPDDYVAALDVIQERGTLAERIAEPLRRSREAAYRELARCLRDGAPFV